MDDLDVYKQQGFGNISGFGERPALLIVDFCVVFNDPNLFGGGNISDAIANTRRLLECARNKKLPVAFTRIVYADDGSDVGVFGKKAKGLEKLTEDVAINQIVPELEPVPGEYIVRKTQPSAFFGTGLLGWLILNKVDTVVVTGCTTSGCVRASVIDSMSNNYLTIVATDGVGDRAIGPHEANLFDMGQKYADLMSCDEIVAALSKQKAPG